jgi:hypothetical protein
VDHDEKRNGRPIVAVLDFSNPAPERGSTGAKVVYPETQAQGGYPVYHVASLFTPIETSRMRGLLGGMGTEESITLRLPPMRHGSSVESESDLDTARQTASQTTISPVPDPIPLAMALWRLRLWRGEGWTGPSPSGDPRGDDTDVREQERQKGRVVQGFRTVQDVLHAKWP